MKKRWIESVYKYESPYNRRNWLRLFSILIVGCGESTMDDLLEYILKGDGHWDILFKKEAAQKADAVNVNLHPTVGTVVKSTFRLFHFE